jgi:hypothetical protein
MLAVSDRLTLQLGGKGRRKWPDDGRAKLWWRAFFEQGFSTDSLPTSLRLPYNDLYHTQDQRQEADASGRCKLKL